MHRLRQFFSGPWRAVPVLGVTQVLGWGVLFYPPVLMMPLIAADRGWSMAFAMGGFSVGLLVAGMVAPHAGAAIDRYGGHVVMTIGSLAGALGLVLLVYAANPIAYLAVWALLGAAMAGSMYDPAFATLGRIFGRAARRPIIALTLAGGFASTVSWPATYALLAWTDWRGAYLVFAALLAFIAAPLHALALPRTRANLDVPAEHAAAILPEPVLPPRGPAFLLVAAGFSAYAFVPSALSAHLLAIFGRVGIEPATVVVIGALFGPSQVTARLCEFALAGNRHPLAIARFAVALLIMAFLLLAAFGFSVATAAAFAMMFGAANGLLTIARGAVPLALFGAAGYGHLLGRIAKPYMLMQAAAPLVMAFVAERASDAAALAMAGGFAMAALICLLLIRRPG
jgi:MFS family permease